MKLNEKTAIQATLGIAMATLCAVATLAWHASAINTKMETLWADYCNRMQSVAALHTTKE